MPAIQRRTGRRETEQERPVQQIVSRERVAQHAEVYTHPREVNLMLDLVKDEAENIYSRFLEPACGTGNFLAEVLTRKLADAARRCEHQRAKFSFYIVVSLGAIYGIDILGDNVVDCQRNLLDTCRTAYTDFFREELPEELGAVLRFIVARNIVWGDALTLETCEPKGAPIVFSQWAAVGGEKIHRTDFTFAELTGVSLAGVVDRRGVTQLGFEDAARLQRAAGTENDAPTAREPLWAPRPHAEFHPVSFLGLRNAAKVSA